MRKRRHRMGNCPTGGERDDHQGQTMPTAEPGTNPQPTRSSHGKIRKIARRFTWKAFKALEAVMQDGETTGTARATAANAILEWGHGKRAGSAKAVKGTKKAIKVDWGEE
jgi:hypothetical protein